MLKLGIVAEAPELGHLGKNKCFTIYSCVVYRNVLERRCKTSSWKSLKESLCGNFIYTLLQIEMPKHRRFCVGVNKGFQLEWGHQIMTKFNFWGKCNFKNTQKHKCNLISTKDLKKENILFVVS